MIRVGTLPTRDEFVRGVDVRERASIHPSIHSVDPVYGMYFVCMECACIWALLSYTIGIASHTRRARASLSMQACHPFARAPSESSRARDAGDGDADLDAREVTRRRVCVRARRATRKNRWIDPRR